MNPMNERNSTVLQSEEGCDNLQNNACCECKEGYIFGDWVYCNLDGRFHPMHDDLICKSYVSNASVETK